MQKKEVVQKVINCVAPIAEALGLELVDVEYKNENGTMNLTLFVDKADGVNLSDCEALHNAVDYPLDELDPTNSESYVLNVSSLGLDRPLKTDKDLSRNIGQMVEFHLFVAINKKKDFVGKLVAFSENKITVQIDNKNFEFERKLISKITKEISF